MVEPRKTVAAGALLAAVGALLLAPTPAQADTWHTANRIHGAVLQVCTRPVGSTSVAIRVRLDNRRAAHTHLGGVTAPDGRSRNLRVPAGRLSSARSLVVRRSASVSIGLGETDGRGSGDVLRAGSLGRC